MSRLLKLKRRPNLSNIPDEYVQQMLDEALQEFLIYTHQPVDLGDRIDAIIIEMAVIKINRQGGEGSSAAAEGSMSRTWDALPADMRSLMNRLRLIA